MIRLRVDEAAAIPLAVESASPVSMTVKEEFIDRGGASIQSNKNATPGASAVEVTPDPGYDALAKVTVEAVPQGALKPIDIDFDDSTGAFTAEARVGTSGYLSDDAFVGGGFLLDTQEAATITPSNVQQQAVAAHKYTTGAVVVDPIPSEYIIPSGTKNITANGNGQDVVGYAAVNVNVPNSYAAADEGKVVSNGALVSQSSATYTENGTYDTTTKNEVVVDVQSGGGEPILLASETATEDVSVMTISYDPTTMSGYTYFELEIEGVATSAKTLYPCPQINKTSNKQYNGYVGANAAFHFYAPVVPYYSGNSHNIQGYRVSIGSANEQQPVNGTISSFSYASYYPEGGFRSGTVFKVWGIPT